jgi:hypothetical protein
LPDRAKCGIALDLARACRARRGKAMREQAGKTGWIGLWPRLLFGALLGYWPRLLFLIPLAAVLCLPFYNRIEPTLWGIPFFYWYQLALVLACALLVMAVYVIETRFKKTAEQEDREADTTPGEIL